MQVEQIPLKNGTALGIKIEMNSAPLLLIKAKNGFAMCSYLNIETANKLNDIAVIVKGVKSFEDVLNANVIAVSEKAMKIGIKEGMNCRDCLEKMF